MPHRIARLAVAGLTAAAVVLTAAAPAMAAPPVLATYQQSIPAATPGGVNEAMTLQTARPSDPYDPQQTVSEPKSCLLAYHEWFATPGCGGINLTVKLHNIRNQPGYIAGLSDPEDPQHAFRAYADTARTFGCRNANGSFDWNTAFVLKTTQQQLDAVYWTWSASQWWNELRSYPYVDAAEPQFYTNFAPVVFSCPAGKVRTQFGIKVTNVRITIDNSAILGAQTWQHAGPFYG